MIVMYYIDYILWQQINNNASKSMISMAAKLKPTVFRCLNNDMINLSNKGWPYLLVSCEL